MPPLLLWEKADQNAVKMALIPQTFLIFVQNLSEILELLNCNAAEKSDRLIMAKYVNLFRDMEVWSLILCNKQKYK